MKSHIFHLSLVALGLVVGTSCAVQANGATVHKAHQLHKKAPSRANFKATYPRLVVLQNRADCELILKAADGAFSSQAARVYESGNDVRLKDRSLIVWPSSDGTMDCDPRYFDCRQADDGSRICVQKNDSPDGGLVVKKKEFNWQGDWHDVVLYMSTQNVQETIDSAKAADFGVKQLIPPDVQVIISGAWQRPWIFRNSANDHYLVIDTQHPAEFMADWIIYGPTGNGMSVIGKVQFHPPAKSALSVIPDGPLRELAVLLDKVIGTPREPQGTLNANDRVRIEAATAWGNVVYRPWAVAKSYNSRATVDRGLRRWAKGSSTYARQYSKLKQLYPLALDQLTLHYERSLGKSHAAAAGLAKTALDRAFCSHFVFPSDETSLT